MPISVPAPRPVVPKAPSIPKAPAYKGPAFKAPSSGTSTTHVVPVYVPFYGGSDRSAEGVVSSVLLVLVLAFVVGMGVVAWRGR
ncbi:hypothetical protein HOS58_gp52 [Streptomyces phage Attoomi]|uniref:Uncharacterized protein n=1 Tax=Streptomyces phage Attoomi TaxID=2059881 RepID=A0A2H5BLM5_9CAUD|nr:hypothetical protein HOS58_gp52 [Streptomyces phage Attoomi]AUG87184.1 hypothetical protein SEA_ATTOOMI_52 [Streptomyces phage Attoomi]